MPIQHVGRRAPVVSTIAHLSCRRLGVGKIALGSSELRDNGLPRIVGNSAALRRVFAMVRIVAPTDATVLINGGNGKRERN